MKQGQGIQTRAVFSLPSQAQGMSPGLLALLLEELWVVISLFLNLFLLVLL